MKEILFSEESVLTAVVVASVMMVSYVCVCLAVGVDLRSGLRKARAAGEKITSSGYRRSVRKLGDYLMVMTGLAVVDLLYCWAVSMLRALGGMSLPAFPFLTVAGALLICLLEMKSVMENMRCTEGLRRQMRDLSAMVSDEEMEAFLAALKKLREAVRGKQGAAGE